MDLVLGTKNAGKIRELRALLSDLPGLHLLTVDVCPFGDVNETGETFVENALLKGTSIARELGLPVLAEDAGLEVEALRGAPGVRSARYSGEPVDIARNNAKLLDALRGVTNRSARFVAAAAFCRPDGSSMVAVGTLEGTIASQPRGCGGFGYDPVFIPTGWTRTLAEMSDGEKNAISHRRKAIAALRGALADAVRSS
ncbi:MAG: RdgB/HAM1 family non-canonical purine NTP pyrophosphatase [Candidatus Bipolaricaulota bacterium]